MLTVWSLLKEQISEKLAAPVEVFIPKTITEEIICWFQEIELEEFRNNLRYSIEEIKERFTRSNCLLLFLLVEKEPIATVFGYTISRDQKEVFYLDVLAVTIEKKGLGTIIMQQLIIWAKNQGYKGIQLDTEEENERGIPLVKFYQKFGFEKTEKDEESGDISMVLFFT